MALRVYLVPVIGGSGAVGDSRRPKYLTADTLTDQRWTSAIAGMWRVMDYGDEPVMLVVADVTPTEHATITANADAIAAPADLTTLIGPNLSTVQNALEGLNIPTEWITATMTYRTVLRWVSRLFMFHQRFQGLLGGRFFPPGITLNSTVGDLTANQRQRVQQAAASFGISTAGITVATTIRVALKLLADQLPGDPNL